MKLRSPLFLFQVISAQQLPKPEWDKPSSIVDPQVQVEIHGVPIDNNKKKTHYVDNNGKYTNDKRPFGNLNDFSGSIKEFLHSFR